MEKDLLIHAAVTIAILVLLGYIYTIDKGSQVSVFIVLTSVVGFWFSRQAQITGGTQ